MSFLIKNSSGGNLNRVINVSSSNDFKFSELPPINLQYKDLVDLIRTPFTGNYELKLEEPKEGEY
jgi:hypothetical protein